MRTKQEEWNQITDKARWYELPQRSIGLGAVLGLTVACLGLLVMFLQFYLQFPMNIFWMGCATFLIGSAFFAYSERAQIVRNEWRAQREYRVESRGKTHRCMHLEGELPTHLRDARQATCNYYEKTFQFAPLCAYCPSYSPEIAPATPPEGVPSVVPEGAFAASSKEPTVTA